MDIVFVNDINFDREAVHPQLGQLILNRILKDKFETCFVNFDYLNARGILPYADTPEKRIVQCGDYLLNLSPKIVGFYTICNTFIFSIQIAKYIKEQNPDVKIIMGGPHASMTAASCLNAFEFIDVISIGEAELTIEHLVTALLNGTSLMSVKNIAFRKDNCIQFTSKERLLNDHELGNYTVLDYSPFELKKSGTFELEGGRGCPYGCSFCSTSLFWGRRFRIKPLSVIINEMNEVNRQYGISSFSIMHDMFTANRDFIVTFCNYLISNNLNYEWSCSARVDSLDSELLKLMRQSGCKGIYLGIETGSQRMQALINKHLKLDDAFAIIEEMQHLGFRITTSFIYCLPNETVADFRDTLMLIEKLYILNIDAIQLHRFMPLPATKAKEEIASLLDFDETTADLSIFHRKNITSDGINIIKQYPDLFSQYYSFPSEVNEAYPKIDFFILVLSSLRNKFGHTISNIVKYYGLQRLYTESTAAIEQGFELYAKLDGYEECYGKIYYTKIGNLFVPILDSMCHSLPYSHFYEIYRYEKISFDMMIGVRQETCIESFAIDMEEYIKTGCIREERMYIRFTKKNDDVLTTKMSPLYGVMKSKLALEEK